MSKARRILLLSGTLYFSALLICSQIYFKERLILPDCANYLFDLLSNGGHLAIFHKRYIAAATQIIPFLSIKAGGSLEVVARLYSLNTVLFPLGCFLICLWPLRHPRAALILLLTQALINSESFFWMVSELQPAISLSCVLIGVLDSEDENKKGIEGWKLVVIPAMSFVLAFAHPLMLFVVGYLLAYLWWRRPQNKRILLFCGATFFVSLVLQWLFRDVYEGHALGGMRNFEKLFPNYFQTDSLHRFILHAAGDYFWLALCFFAVLFFYFFRRQYLKAAAFLLACFGYLLFVTVCFPDWPGFDFYHENLYLPLAFFVALPLAMELAPEANLVTLSFLALTLMLSAHIGRIEKHGRLFAEKLDWKRRMIRAYEGKKVILNPKDIPEGMTPMSWSSPFEFWLLSTLENKKTSSLIIAENPDAYMEHNGQQMFLTPFRAYPYAGLKEPYFVFRDSVSSYEVVQH